MFARIPLLLALLHIAAAEQPTAPKPIAAPLRELPWGQINFLHTTDVHGWHGGHLQEPQYAADWGDYISFASHLRDRTDKNGTDLLLIDTGDRVEGNGLYDASNPKGRYLNDIVRQQKMDVVTVGNHELYLANATIREFQEVVPAFRDAYIASNLDVIDPQSGKQVPLAQRYRKFTTKNQGIRVLAFGFLFNFKGNSNSSIVQPVEETIKETWFQEAIQDKSVDLFLVSGHVPVHGWKNDNEFDALYKAIRSANWDAPIVFFGGHTHIRDYRKYESNAWGLESGRYMETLGFMSVTGVKTGKKDVVVPEAGPVYQRRYIDNNLYSLLHHSEKNASTFNTELGRNVSKAIAAARKELQLDKAYGCAPQNYWLNRAPYPANDSLLSLLEKHVLPDTFKKTGTPSIVITNSGAIRFDIFQGPFTIDSTFLISPFTSGFRAFKDVPYTAASQVLKFLNERGPILAETAALAGMELDPLLSARPPVSQRSMNSISRDDEPLLAREGQQQVIGKLDGEPPKLPGYTTSDDGGKDGDDTIHEAIKFYNVPNCVGTNVGFSAEAGKIPDTVDLVFNEFITPWVVVALRVAGLRRDAPQAVSVLDGKTMTDVISEWIQGNWACKK